MSPVFYVRFFKTHPETRPPAGFIDLFYDMSLSSPVLMSDDGIKIPVGGGSSSGPAVWGGITGTLSAQADLQAELDAKFNKSGGAITGDVTVSLVLQTMGLLVSDSVSFAATNYTYGTGAAAAHREALGAANSIHVHEINQVAGLSEALDTKAPTADPTFTGAMDVTGDIAVSGSMECAVISAGEFIATDSASLNVATTINGEFNHAGDVITLSNPAAWKTALGIAPVTAGLREHSTTDDTIVLEDRYVRTTSANDVDQRIPNDSVVDFPIGTKITFRQAGQGTINLVAGAGVDLNGQLTTQGRHRSLGIIKVGPNEWDTERGAF